jgi:type IV pilus biogenesis protein PilP
MQNKIFKNAFIAIMAALFAMPSVAEDLVEQSLDDVSAAAIAEYEIDGTLFQKITDLEQDKILMQLEKEKAQLDLDLDRLAAEKIKLHMEIDTLSGRAEEQQAALESEREKLEVERERLERDKQSQSTQSSETRVSSAPKKEEAPLESITKKYSLIDIIGAGKQLHATVQDLNNGQRKKISVGRELDGYVVKSISLDDGVVFVKDELTETLNISKDK